MNPSNTVAEGDALMRKNSKAGQGSISLLHPRHPEQSPMRKLARSGRQSRSSLDVDNYARIDVFRFPEVMI